MHAEIKQNFIKNLHKLSTAYGAIDNEEKTGYIVMLRARMFRSLIIRTGIKERNIRARNITI